MLQDICNLLRDKINTIQYFDLVAGLVQTQEQKIVSDDGTSVIKRFPISADVTAEECQSGPYRDLVPDSSKRGIAYFEASNIGLSGRRYTFGKAWNAQVRLVAWINKDYINGGDPGSINAEVIAAAIEAVKVQYTAPPFKNIRVIPTGVVENSPAIFSAYTYDNVDTQFLMAPYTYFAVDMQVTFILPEICTPTLKLNFKTC